MKKIILGVVFTIFSVVTLGAVTIENTVDKSEYFDGETLSYTLRVENTGTQSESNLTLENDLSSLPLGNISSVGVTSSGGGNTGTITETSGDIEITGITVEEGGYVEYTYTADITSGTTSTITTDASIAGGSLPGIQDEDSATTTPIDLGKVTLRSESNVSEYDNGEVLSYTITIVNNTTRDISGLTYEDDYYTLLGGAAVESPSATSSNSTTSNPGTFQGTPTLGAKFTASNIILGGNGGSVTYELSGVVATGIDQPFVNSGTLTGSGINLTSGSDPASIPRTVYDYSVEKSVDIDEYSPGGTLEYTLLLRNNKNNTVRGLKIEDLLSSVTTDIVEGGQGPAFTDVTVVGTTTGSGSDDGLMANPLSGDLVANDVEIGPSGTITYKVTATVASNAIGDIENTAVVTETTRDDNTKSSNTVTVEPGVAAVTIEKKVDVTSNYLPEDNLVYTITVENEGGGTAANYKVSDDITAFTNNLANLSSQPTSSQNIMGSPFDEVVVELVEIGAKSTSTYSVGLPITGSDLDDDVNIFPGEKLVYEIRVKTNPSAIDEINNQASVSDGTITTTSNVAKTTPKALNESNVTITKFTTSAEYEPGDTITYTIRVKNNKTDQFVDNFLVTDNLNDVVTEQLDGTTGKAFSSWTLNVIDPTNSQNGTKPGTSISGTPTTDDIALNVDIAPGEEVEYELIVVISETSVGNIFDGNSSGDNVIEQGSGINMAAPNLSTAKVVDDTEYSPNETINYTLIVDNDGDGYAVNTPVIDKLSEIKTSTGKQAYSSWTITSTVQSIDGSGSGIGDSGILSEPLVDQDLDVIADVGPNTRIIYNIAAVVDGVATGKIVNEALVSNNLVADKGIFPVEPDVTVEKSVDIGSYSDENPIELTYTIVVANGLEGGYAEDVKVVDDPGSVKVTQLNGDVVDAFTGWTITARANNGSEGEPGDSNTTVTTPIVNGELDDIANITAGGNITYTIKASVNKDLSIDDIPYGSITNTVEVTPTDINGDPDTTIISSATTEPKDPNLSIVKATTNNSFSPGDVVNYSIRVTNRGDGFANNAQIKDTLSTNFSSWTITTATDGDFGSTNYRGTNPDINNDLANNKDIDIIADISPNGYVEYNIVAVVKNDFSENNLTNRATVFDPESGNTYESSAELANSDIDTKGIYITKEVDKFEHVPGEPLTYTVRIFNPNSNQVDFGSVNFEIRDDFGDIINNLANDGSNPTADITGSPFGEITVTGSDGSTSVINEGDNFVGQPIVAGGTEASPGEFTYTFTTTVKDSLLEGKIKNEAVLYNSSGERASVASVETNRAGGDGGFSRAVDKTTYAPGDMLTYTFTADPSGVFINNQLVEEKILDLQVDLIDGTTGNPFFNPLTGQVEFTVEKYVNGVLNGTPSTTATNTGSVSDNTNIGPFTIDVHPDDKIEYVVTGRIRPEADGTINYKGLITDPVRHNLLVAKTVTDDRYIPGGELQYVITIDNRSDGNAGKIPIKDMISSLTVELADGSIVPAYENGIWTVTTETENISGTTGTDYTDYVNPDIEGKLGNNQDIDTTFALPVWTRLKYIITGNISEEAVGGVLNTVTVDGDQVSSEGSSGTPNVQATKSVAEYLDRDGSTTLSGGYKPGGYIVYEIRFLNIGTGVVDDFTFEDLISEIKTTDIDGNTIDAFSTWTIDEEFASGTTVGNSSVTFPQSDVDIVEGSPSGGQINPVLDLGVGEEVTYTIKAKVDERAAGSIQNEVSSGTFNRRSEVSNSLGSSVTLTKEAYESDSGGNITSSVKSTYKAGDIFYYRVRVENTGDGISKGSMKDTLSTIMSEVANDGTNGSNPSDNSFTTFTVVAEKGNDEVPIGDPNGGTFNNNQDNVTNLDDFEVNGTQVDTDINSNIVVAPGGYIEYVIKVETRDDIISRISNTATYNNTSKTKNVDPLGGDIAVSKNVTSIGGEAYSSGDTYSPGDEVIYEIVVENSGEGFENDVRIQDLVSNIVAETAGGGSGAVFESYEITTDGGTDERTYIPEFNGVDADLNVVADIAPESNGTPERVTFTVKGIVASNIVGEIPGNKVTVGDDSATSETIPPMEPNITYYKTFLGPRGEVELDNFTYSPFNNINYKVVVKNTGEGYGNDVTVRDILDDVVDGAGNKAFTSVVYQTKIIAADGSEVTGTTNGNTVISGTTSGSGAIDVSIDIAPMERVEFLISGTVTGTAAGDITNKVEVSQGSIESGEVDEVTASQRDAEIIISKDVTSQTYTPGGPISYEIIVRNTSQNNATNLILNDIISDIDVDLAGGGNGPALKPGWTITSTVEDDNSNSDITNLTALSPGSDISNVSVTLGSKKDGEDFSFIRIKIDGTVVDDAVGPFLNTASYTLDGENGESSVEVFPEDGDVNITKDGVDSRTGTTIDTTYTPGEEKTFLVKISNNGSGFAKGVVIEDILSDIFSESAGSLGGGNADSEKAFPNGSSNVTTNISSLTNSKIVGTPITSDGFQGEIDLAPGETFEIRISGVVSDNIVGSITNDASYMYNGVEEEDSVTLNSVEGSIAINKYIVDENGVNQSVQATYVPGQELEYVIELTNSGKGWSDNVIFVDNIGSISTEVSGGGSGSAFISGSVEATTPATENIVLGVDSSDRVDAILDIAPGETVTINIKGDLEDNLLGEFVNKGRVTADARAAVVIESNEVKAVPKLADLTITKTILNADENYRPGGIINYAVKVENTSDSFANDVNIVDDIDSIVATNSSGSSVAAFDSFVVNTLEIEDENTIITSNDTTLGADIVADIAPNSSITVLINARVAEDIVGPIVNEATYTYEGNSESDDVTSVSRDGDVTIEKTNFTQEYIVGGEVSYIVRLTNEGEGIADDLDFVDDLGAIQSELIDGTTGPGIVPGTASVRVVGTDISPTPTFTVTSDKVEGTFDMAPDEFITLEVRGTVEDNVIGNLTNIASYEYTTNQGVDESGEDSATIGQANANITILKEAVIDPAIGGYIPGGEVNFILEVENIGSGVGDDITITDELSSVMVEGVNGTIPAFTSWTITTTSVSSGSTLGSYNSSSDLDVLADILPDGKITFAIKAIVDGDAFGEIKNIGVASYKDDLNNDGTPAPPVEDEASFIPSRSEVSIENVVDKTSYGPSEKLTYTITLSNEGPGRASDVNFKGDFGSTLADTINGSGAAFDTTTLNIESVVLSGGASEGTPLSIVDGDVVSIVDIPRDGKIVYKVSVNTADNVIGQIDQKAAFDYTDNDGTEKDDEAIASTLPKNADISIVKTSDVEEFVAGDDITYTIVVKNSGEGIGHDIEITDELSKITSELVDGTTGKAFDKWVITDNIPSSSTVTNIDSYVSNGDLKHEADIAPGDNITFKIVATTNEEVGGDITNEVSYEFVNNDGSRDSGDSSVTSKVILNSGMLELTKEALSDEVEKGGVVEYEIIVRNPTDVYFVDVVVEDKTPAGFDYVKGSTEMTLTGDDNEFDTDDDEVINKEPIVGSGLTFMPVDIGPGESLRIRYLLKASIGTTFGDYKNTAYATSNNERVSNEDTATVEVIPDDLFDTASIIGKVFEDIDRNGYQGDATAKGIKVVGGVSRENYIPNSSVLIIGSKGTKLKDASPPLEKGVKIGKIAGISKNRRSKGDNIAKIRFKTRKGTWEPLTITTRAGTTINIDGSGNITSTTSKKIKDGVFRERLNVTQNTYYDKVKDIYMQELVIENLGVYEEGVPGIRLVTLGGITVETDEFGRYHIPDELVENRKGENFLVKLDKDTLPKDMEIISENPRVQRITPNSLSKFNFSISLKKDSLTSLNGGTKGQGDRGE